MKYLLVPAEKACVQPELLNKSVQSMRICLLKTGAVDDHLDLAVLRPALAVQMHVNSQRDSVGIGPPSAVLLEFSSSCQPCFSLASGSAMQAARSKYLRPPTKLRMLDQLYMYMIQPAD